MDLEIRALLDDLFDRLDRLDYYALLGVPTDADDETIRAAFYRRAEILHPDRHFNLRDTDLREKIHTVYKRVAEGYRVLMIAETRAEYDEQLRMGRKRYLSEARKDVRRDPELKIRSLRARRLYLDAQTAIREGNTKGARIALQLALLLEPGSSVIQAALDEVEQSEAVKGIKP